MLYQTKLAVRKRKHSADWVLPTFPGLRRWRVLPMVRGHTERTFFQMFPSYLPINRVSGPLEMPWRLQFKRRKYCGGFVWLVGCFSPVSCRINSSHGISPLRHWKQKQKAIWALSNEHKVWEATSFSKRMKFMGLMAWSQPCPGVPGSLGWFTVNPWCLPGEQSPGCTLFEKCGQTVVAIVQ